MNGSNPFGQGSNPWGRAKRNYGVSVVCHGGLKIHKLRFESVWFHKNYKNIILMLYSWVIFIIFVVLTT